MMTWWRNAHTDFIFEQNYLHIFSYFSTAKCVDFFFSLFVQVDSKKTNKIRLSNALYWWWEQKRDVFQSILKETSFFSYFYYLFSLVSLSIHLCISFALVKRVNSCSFESVREVSDIFFFCFSKKVEKKIAME